MKRVTAALVLVAMAGGAYAIKDVQFGAAPASEVAVVQAATVVPEPVATIAPVVEAVAEAVVEAPVVAVPAEPVVVAREVVAPRKAEVRVAVAPPVEVAKAVTPVEAEVEVAAVVEPLVIAVDEPRCEEDMPCWDCATMGNKICGPAFQTNECLLRKGFELPVECTVPAEWAEVLNK